MRLTSITMANYGPYKEKQTVTVPGSGKVAVVGENGAGKSFLFDAIPLALFGRATNRPKGIYELFNDHNRQPVKDGFIELVFELGGKQVKVRRLVDSVARKQMPTISVDGVVLTEGKAAQFDAEIEKLGLNESVFLTSAYSSQNGAGHLIGLADGERRGVFEAILGLGDYAEAHTKVKQELAATEKEKDLLSAQRQTLQASIKDTGALMVALASKEAELSVLQFEANELKKQEQAKREELATAVGDAKHIERLQVRLSEVEAVIASRKAKEADLGERIDNNNKLLLAAAAIEAAANQYDELQGAVKRYQQEMVTLSHAMNEALTAHNEANRAALAELQANYNKAVEEWNNAGRDLASHEAEVKAKRTELEQLEKSLAEKTEQAKLVEQVPCSGQPVLINQCQLLSQANMATYQSEHLLNRVADLQTWLEKADEQTKTLDWLCNQAKSLKVEAETTLKTESNQLAYPEYLSAQKGHFEALQQAVSDNQLLMASLKTKAGLKGNLALAKERLAGYLEELQGLNTAILKNLQEKEALQKDIAAASHLEQTRQQVEGELQTLHNEVERKQALVNAVQRELGAINADLATAEETRQQIEALTSKLMEKLALTDRLRVLEEGLSPKGAPALKVDAAGPEITAIINNLLLACYGNRFTVRLDTQKANLSNDNKREVLQLAVVDNESGEETAVESLSGGEQAIVKEAISLGLAVFARRHCGVDLRCLIRDETTAPLSDDNGERYIQMLEQALAEGGFDQVLFVSHKPSLQAMADAVIEVKQGQLLAA